ncbi:MAG: thioredoxin-disulfide reductase [Clostridia bacterium]|nr:thioredoxin-disulfide reductase [Clostridia bacterium]
MYDIIIVGAGTAGLTAALYALRANKKILILEAKSYGGQIINAHKVENYPGIASISGFEFATNLYNQVKNLGAEIKYETVVRVDENRQVTTDKATYEAKAVILATGSENRKLRLENEAAFVGKGVSYCATCDGNFYKHKVVAVVGGGNRALEDAVYLADLASKVYLIHRRDEFTGEEIYLEELKRRENVEFVLNSNVTRLNGEELLESIDLQDKEGNTRTIPVNGLFIAVGQAPRNDIFANIIELDKAGYIKSEDGVHTNVPGIYVAGDCRVKNLRQLTTAVGDGADAATTAIKEMAKE